MVSPRPLFCRCEEFVEYADGDPRWATGEQIGDPKGMAESMTPAHRSTRWLQWKHTVVDDSVKTLTKGYKRKKGFCKTASSHGEGDSRKCCACEYRVRRSAEGCNSLLRFCTLSRGRSLFSLRERWCQKINVLLCIYMRTIHVTVGAVVLGTRRSVSRPHDRGM